MLAAIALLAVNTVSPGIADGTYRYTASIGGAAAGSATIVVKGGFSPGQTTCAVLPIEIDERSNGAMNGRTGTAQVKLVLGTDLSPVSYQGSYDLDGDQSTADVTLTPTTATMGSQSFGLIGSATHFVVLEPGLLAGMIALPAQMQAWKDSAVTALVPSIGISAAIEPDASVTGARPPGVPPADVALSFGGLSPFTIWYDPATLVADELEVPSQNIVVTRARP